jgi:hypothetical protein
MAQFGRIAGPHQALPFISQQRMQVGGIIVDRMRVLLLQIARRFKKASELICQQSMWSEAMATHVLSSVPSNKWESCLILSRGQFFRTEPY